MTRKDETPEFGHQTVVGRIAALVEAYDRPTCVVDGCDGSRKIRQYCQRHYDELESRGEHPKNEPRIRISESYRTLLLAAAFESYECFNWAHTIDAGYPIFGFKGKIYRAHVAVCEDVHGPKPEGRYEVAHECGNSRCCNPTHLAWKTHRENIADKRRHGTMLIGERHHQSKLTESEVREIRSGRGRLSRRQLAEKFGVGRSTVDNILDGVTWRDVA